MKNMRARLSGLYGALFFTIGIYLPFFPVWLQARGLTTGEIALVLASQIAVRTVSGPLFSFVVDKTGARRRVLIWLAVLPFAGALALTFVNSVWLIGLVAVSSAFFWAPIVPMTEVIAVRGASDHGLDYGRMRLWGSLAFMAASLGGGLALDVIDPGEIIWVLAASHGLILVAILCLPKSSDPARATSDGAKQVRIRDAVKLLVSPMFLVFLMAAGLTQASHSVYYSFGTLHWQASGIPGGVIGILWSLGVVAEVALFFVSGRAVRLFTPTGLLVLGAGAAVVRWSGTALDPGLAGLVVLQLLHGLTFGATHLGVMHHIARTVPDHLHNTAQALYSAVAGGLIISLATASAGPLYLAYGANAFLAASLMAAAAGGFALLLVFRASAAPE
ncbi:MAG: MFS transporter [Alphaproteobacteria bacterium]|nr:MFS transporter [Alphaproteobacteria bacterium]